MHAAYRSLIVNRAASAIAEAQALGDINHSGLKGQLRELVIRELLEPLLPPGCIIGTGEVVSAYEGTSNQMDVVVADRRVLPPVLIRDAGIFPLEACLLTVEIKSRLTAVELRTSHASARKLAGFHHAPPVGAKEHPPGDIEHVIPFLLAFGTDLAQGGKTEIQRYLEIAGDDPPAIRGLCVVGRGYWYFDEVLGWQDGTLAISQGDLVGMVGDIINVAQRVAATRRQPDIREYLVWDHVSSDR
jgi:hypothetical protein